MKNEIVKFDSESLFNRITEAEKFSTEVRTKIEGIIPKLPTDLKALDVIKGNKIEDQLSGAVSKISKELKLKKDSRLEMTRKLDEVKKQFTTYEKYVSEDVEKLNTFINGWNSEKLRRKREEEQRLEKENERRNYLIEFASQVSSHYTSKLNDFEFGSKQELENDFYNLDEKGLNDFKSTTIDPEVVKEKLKEFLKENPLKGYDSKDEELKKIRAKELQSLSGSFSKSIQNIIYKAAELKSFIPSRIHQLKEQDENQKAEEQKRLKEKQAQEKSKKEAELKQQQADKLLEEKVNSAMQAAEAKPTVDLSKGASVKLKYNPTTHAELLKMVQYYIGEHYNSEDFETLFKRLSFMRTACDRDLNKEDSRIEGVPVEEIVSKRKSK